MKTLHVDLGSRSYDIQITPGLLNQVGQQLRAEIGRASCRERV